MSANDPNSSAGRGAAVGVSSAAIGFREAVADAQAPTVAFAQLLERLADKVGGHADVRAVFGQEISQGSVTVIPVATVFGGFGAGGGVGDTQAGEVPAEPHATDGSGRGGGLGAGGAFVAMPTGFIEIEGGHAHFRRINDPVMAFGARAGLPGLALGLAVQGVRVALALWDKRKAAKVNAKTSARDAK
jgi:uncharacterized spore protein YtfJ